MKLALLTPMKPPDDPVPSGDRTFARLVRAALERAGHAVSLPSRLVTWRATPDGLDALLDEARREGDRILARWQAQGPPDAVITYHNYHKAPDLLGPRLAAAFGLPYAIVEASRAARRATGPWARHFALADAALDRADAVGAVTDHDRAALEAHMPDRVTLLPPYIDTTDFARPREGADGARLVSAAMMREGRKADSVRLLAEVLAVVRRAVPGARLVIAGDGNARAALEPLFAPGTFVGRLDREALAALFASADLFVWPALDEPFGFAFLEAQAAGLPVAGGAARGVVDVVRDGHTGLLAPQGDAAALAGAVVALLRDPVRRAAMGEAARAFAEANDLAAGARRLDGLLAMAERRRTAGRLAAGAGAPS
jgi:glycosyltransferase involved in cell wall biosynthesis